MAELLGMFEQAVLLAVMHLGDEAYGRAVLNRVEELLQRGVSAGAVYATLDRLESAGLAGSRLENGTPVRGGRPRRFYAVSAAGEQALRETRATLTTMWKHVRIAKEARA